VFSIHVAQAKKKMVADNPEHPPASLKLIDELAKAFELAEVRCSFAARLV
jgi:hypothetical protein